MWWNALLAAFGLVFVAELGDKSQIIILTLAARHGFKQVFLGVATAFALLNILAVSLGALLYRVLPEAAIRYPVSAIFLIFGILALLPQKEKDEDQELKERGRRPVLSSFLMVCLMELGDKTQLSLLALTAKYSQPIFVFIGGTLALWLASFIAALVGAGLGRFISQVWMRRISGVIFIAFGIINLFW
ncbi:MAG: TMEM165/GDT1 family protein [Actinomycetota bacterium]|nr:TMEM165/GDT1 family protein [Actinomycetota bacterium]